jgi:hypothetical protein
VPNLLIFFDAYKNYKIFHCALIRNAMEPAVKVMWNVETPVCLNYQEPCIPAPLHLKVSEVRDTLSLVLE